jgi:uncharacterized protein (TIGR01777 family)
MKRYRELCLRSRQPAPPELVRQWLARPGADQRLAPPWRGGQQPLALTGWEHHQRLTADGDGTTMQDELRATASAPATDAPVRAFTFRHRQLARDLRRHQSAPPRPLVVAMTGASGLIGSALTAFLTSGGHRVRRLVRRQADAVGPELIFWDPQGDRIEADKLEGVDAVVNLAGESIGEGRWTAERKRRILASRVSGTDLLVRTLARLVRPPRVLVSGSGVGYYGMLPTGTVDESARPGDDFLAGVTRQWEAAAAPARARGIRVAHPRLASVLDPRGGALQRMLPIYRAGLGGKLGSGRQPFPWVALDDAVGAIHHALMDDGLEGPFNVIAPGAVTNAQFSQALAAATSRPDLYIVPGWALKLAVGELAAALLAGPDIVPARLLAAGFRFQHPNLLPALTELLGSFPLPEPVSDDGQRLELEV